MRRKSKSEGLIFLSYNRDADSAIAHLIETELSTRGYRVFIDVKILPAGDFELHLKMVLERARSMILILSERASDNNSEHQKTELIEALKHEINIVPVIPPNFDWDLAVDKAPRISQARHLNSVVVSFDYRDAFFERLKRFLYYGRNGRRKMRTRKWWQFWRRNALILPSRIQKKLSSQ